MSDRRGEALLDETLEAHGGRERWAAARTITTSVQVRGLMPTALFPGRPIDDYRYTQTVQVQRLHAVLDGFPTAGTTATFTPDEVTVDQDGHRVITRRHPRRAFTGRGAVRRLVRWDIADAAYFLGYAMANYLTHPHLFTRDDVDVRRGADLRTGSETWRRLEVTHPEGFASHCRDEVFYVDEHGLIRRHDYVPDILVLARRVAQVPVLRRTLAAAHFSTRHRDVDGLVLPTFRRVMLAPPGRAPLPGVTIICAQLDDIAVTSVRSADLTEPGPRHPAPSAARTRSVPRSAPPR